MRKFLSSMSNYGCLMMYAVSELPSEGGKVFGDNAGFPNGED